METVITTLKWGVALLFTITGTLIVMAILGVTVQLMSWSIGIAALGDDAAAKYQILFGWTSGALLLGFFAKLWALIRHRHRHTLRITEYLGHAITSGVLFGGLAYGTVSVVVAALNAAVHELQPVVGPDRNSAVEVTFLAIIPIGILMASAVITAEKFVSGNPKSRPPDTTIPNMVRDSRQLRDRTRNLCPWSKINDARVRRRIKRHTLETE